MIDTRNDEAWETVSRKLVADCSPWLKLFTETVRLPSGQIVDDYHQIQTPDFVTVFAETQSEKIIMLRQYKHGVRKTCLTLPGGQVEPDEAPERAARRELLEETGYEAEVWTKLGSYVVHGNMRCCTGHFFMTRHAKPVQEPKSGDLETMELKLLSQAEIAEAIETDQVPILNHVALISKVMAIRGGILSLP